MYLHSSAILFNSFSMTLLMLVCGLLGATELTADIAIVQASTLAFFFAFSANARNLIFADLSGSVSHSLLRARLVLIFPLAVLSFILSSVIGSVDALLALVLIARRSAEWIGEVFLSSYERQSVRRPTMVAVAAEILSLVLVIASLFLDSVDFTTVMILWASAPLVAVAGGRLARPSRAFTLIEELAKLAPNFGSTAIIGIAVYVFRLSIVLLVGRAAAGDLFTAFIIGGMLPTIYNSSIGPSLALRYQREEPLRGPLASFSSWLLPAMFISGVLVAALAINYPETVTVLGKDHLFCTAVGLSLAGGAIMKPALYRRIRMLQAARNIEVFGVDVLSNTLIAVSVPFIFHIFGARSLEGLYFFNALITLSLYWSAELVSMRERPVTPRALRKLLFVGFLIVIPFFLQLSGGVFRDKIFIFDTGRSILFLPIPLSVLGLAIGILLLGRFNESFRSLSIFFFAAISLVVGALIFQEPNAQTSRLVLMAQYLLPMLGLVLGEMYGSASKYKEFEKMCLIVVGVIVPFQLICSWLQGLVILTPYLYLFSIHQHLQYVPTIMVVSYGIAFCSLWNEGQWWRITLIGLLPLMAVYAAASYSIVAMAGLLFIILAILWGLQPPMVSRTSALLILALVLIPASFYYGFFSKKAMAGKLVAASSVSYISSDSSLPINLVDRIEFWKFYGRGILDNRTNFIFGHPTSPDRTQYRSAHNYYLDILYNFGFLALSPLLMLFAYTIWLIYRCRSSLSAERALFAMVVAVFILFVVDNSLKVGLRQPYPGIFSFFLLGLLQARLLRLPKDIEYR